MQTLLGISLIANGYFFIKAEVEKRDESLSTLMFGSFIFFLGITMFIDGLLPLLAVIK